MLTRYIVDQHFQRSLDLGGEWIPGPYKHGYYLSFPDRVQWAIAIDDLILEDYESFEVTQHNYDVAILFHERAIASWISIQQFGFIRYDHLWLVTEPLPVRKPKEPQVKSVALDVRNAVRRLSESPSAQTVRTYNGVRYSKAWSSTFFDAQQRRDRPCVKATEEISGKEVILFKCNVPHQATEFISRMGSEEAFHATPFNDRHTSDFL